MPSRVLVVGDETCARALRDEGKEVVYLEAASAEHIADVAVQEDVSMIVTEVGVAAVSDALAALDADDIAVVRTGRAPAEPHSE